MRYLPSIWVRIHNYKLRIHIEEQYLYGDNEFTVSKEIEKYDVRTINEGLRLIYKELEEGGYYHKEGYAYSANE